MEAQPSKSKWNIWRLLLFVIVFSVGLGCILVFVIKRTLPTETSSFVTVQSPDGRYSLTGRKLILSDSVYFTGFPYAEADERFSKSQLLDMYVNETATQWSEDCPSFYYRGGNEDCLSLNVYRCSSIHNLHLPVLVHINEGEPDTESTANLDPVLVIKNLACRGMIVVSVHYRHSAFSQLYFGNRAFTSNLGVSDVQAALEWVNLNIPKFHGNRSRVTVMGSKTGAAILSHLKLFSNMILVDRAYESPELFSQTSQFLIQQSQRFSTLVGCSKATDKFDETNKSKMSKTMKCAFIRAEAKMLQSWNRWPIDSTELKNAASPSMNVMLGTCHFSSPSQTEASSSFQTRLKKALQTIRDFDRVSNPNDFIEYYTTRFAGYSSLRTALKEIRKDFTELGPLLLEANKFAEVNSNGTKKTFVFDLTTNQSRSDYGNVRQMARQYPPCLEHLLFKKVPEADIKLHNFMVDSVVNFVIKSNPNSVSNDTTSLQWPEFNSIDSTRSILSVNSEGIDVVTNPWPSSLRFWLCEQSKATNSTENCG